AALAPWLEAALAGKATNGEVTLTRANDGARRFQASYIPYCDNDSVRGCYLILSAQQGHDGLHLDDRDQNRLVYIQRLAMIGEMATTLAHDLNQPLSAINSYASALTRMLHAGKPAEETTPIEIGRAQSELQSRFDLVCRLLLEKKKYEYFNT